MRKILSFFILIIVMVFTPAVFAAQNIPIYSYIVVNSYPHDNLAFTQGLFYKDGFLFEGTGLNGHSTLRKVDISTGKVIKMRKLENIYFGEGVTLFDDKIVQLTENNNLGFIYDADSFKLIGKFSYPTAGWGITYDGENLIMSDGTEVLYFLDKKTFKQVKKITVSANNSPIRELNELEYVKGKIYANIWHKDKIAVIDPATGKVLFFIDLSGLLSLKDKKNIGYSVLPWKEFSVSAEKEACLNGIAYDKKNDRLFVTGKLWPKVFELKILNLPSR